jgi:hypothetical protein
MKYETIKKFTNSVGKSRSTIYRFYVNRPDLFSQTKIEDRKRIIPESHQKYFNLEIMQDEYNIVCAENKSMRNLVDGLMDKESLCRTLWDMPWSYFMTVAYKLDRDKKSCYRMMTALYDDLISKYPDTVIRIFFTTERFKNREGHHNHLVIYIQDKRIHCTIVEEIQRFFQFDRVEYSNYDPYKAALFYMSKEGLVNEDWDILGSDLEKIRKDAS